MGNKIIVLCAKSSVGKDTIFNKLVNEHGLLKTTSWTSRPMRVGEADGREYYFCSEKEFNHLILRDYLVEYRTYNTLVGGQKATWYYGLSKDEIDLAKGNYVLILDIKGTEEIINFYGKESIIVFYISADDEIRKERCIARGDYDETEFNRRVLSDEVDFSEDKLKNVVNYYLVNNTIDDLQNVVKFISEEVN